MVTITITKLYKDGDMFWNAERKKKQGEKNKNFKRKIILDSGIASRAELEL